MESKVYTLRGFIFYLILAILIGIGIYYGGNALSRKLARNFKDKIDRHGLFINTIVYSKGHLKGTQIYFRYAYNGKEYVVYEQNADYDNLEIGDPIQIKIDTTNPMNAYIISSNP